MAQTVYLHIGAHKTGTTALQHTAFRHRAALRAQGVDYPEAGRVGVAHHALAVSLGEGPRRRFPGTPPRAALLAALVREIEASPCPSVLISSEALFKTPAAALAPMAEALAPFETRILLTLRRPDDMYLSSHGQRSKDPFDQFKADLRDHLDTPWAVAVDTRFATRIAAWEAAFGPDALQMFVFEDGDPVQQILGAVGVTLPASTDAKARNARASRRLCEVMLWAKRRGLPLRARRILYSVAVRLLRGGPPPTLSDTDRQRILKAALPETEAAFARLGRENPYRPAEVAGRAARQP